MKTLEIFKQQQEKSTKILKHLEDFLQEGENIGVKIDETMKEKLQNALLKTEGQKLKVALIGGFSEGKTSIAAAWIEKLDQSTMKIDHRESSDEVVFYSVGDNLEIVDTPGLFGFKEKHGIDDQTQTKYKDITKKYISEAHLILYVMNAENPIKESHKEDLKWLFRDLELLRRTIFVLSKFDNVADVGDLEDYNELFATKKESIIQRLEDEIKLTPSEKDELSIVAVSANPFDKGINYWLEHLSEFKKLSHIEELQEATSKKIQDCGGSEILIEESKKSIIQDIMQILLPEAERRNTEMQEKFQEHLKIKQELEADLATLNSKISQTRIDLRESLTLYFKDLILQLNGTSIETFKNFYDGEIGKDGIFFETKIQNIFEEKTGAIIAECKKIEYQFETNLNDFGDLMLGFGKNGLSFLQQSGVINASNIKAARDGIVAAGKFVGADLSKILKFPPWGATKLAGRISAALGFFSLGMELWDSYKKAQEEEKFQKTISDIKSNLDERLESLLGGINSEDFFLQFANYKALEESKEEIQNIVNEIEEMLKKFSAWLQRGRGIDAELSELKAL